MATLSTICLAITTILLGVALNKHTDRITDLEQEVTGLRILYAADHSPVFKELFNDE